MYAKLVQINILVLVLSILVFSHFGKLPKSPLKIFFLVLLSLMPIVWFNPHLLPVSLLQLTFIALCLLLPKLPQPARVLLFLIALGVFCWGSLLSGNILTWPLTLHVERTIFSEAAIYNGIIKHQQDAIYLPYRLRLSIYNPLIYFNYFAKNLFGLFTLQRFYDVILLANIYPLVLGIINFLHARKNSLRALILAAVVIIVITTGINKSTDPFNSLFFALPVLVFFIIEGFVSMNSRVYMVLLGLSLILATSPHI